MAEVAELLQISGSNANGTSPQDKHVAARLHGFAVSGRLHSHESAVSEQLPCEPNYSNDFTEQ